MADRRRRQRALSRTAGIAAGEGAAPHYSCMDFDLSDDQRAFQETARQFAQDEWLPFAAGLGRTRGIPRVEALRKAAALGFGGIYVGDDVGGAGSRGSMRR